MPFAMDPVGAGLAQSLAHPAGNVTGLTVNTGAEIFGKILQLLKEVLPGGTRIAMLFNATSQIYTGQHLNDVEDAGRKLGLSLVRAEIRSPDDLDEAFALVKRQHATGVVVLDEPVFYANRRRVNDLALRSGLAAGWPSSQGLEPGALMSYSVNWRDLYRRAATYVDKIFKGAKPGDLPVEQPTKFELAINLKTAKALGLTIPPTLLATADEVIE